jgi:predicted hotdog family 3-hydroxylacyl-ACP dehydratase
MIDFQDSFPKLPHRAPFVLLDRIVEATPERGVCVKQVSASDVCVTPSGELPAAFVLEALAQAGGAYLNAIGGEDDAPAGFLAQVERFVQQAPVRVGDELYLEVRVTRRFRSATVLEGRALVGDAVRAEGRFTLSTGR